MKTLIDLIMKEEFLNNPAYTVRQINDNTYEYLDTLNNKCSKWLYENIKMENYTIRSYFIGLYMYNTVVEFTNKEDSLKFKLIWCGKSGHD